MSCKLFQHRSNNSKNSTAIELNEEGEESTLEQDEIIGDTIVENNTTELVEAIENPVSDQDNQSQKGKAKKIKKRKFCKHCGNILEGKHTHCISCGKWFFAFRKQYFIYLFLILCISGLATTTIIYHSMYVQSSTQAKRNAQTNEELLKKIEQLDKRIPEEYDKGYEDGYETGKANGYTSGYDAGYGTGKSDGYTTGYSVGNSNGYITGKSQAVEQSCAIPSCSSTPQSNSFYCFSHECFKVGCHNQRLNDFSLYCILHK